MFLKKTWMTICSIVVVGFSTGISFADAPSRPGLPSDAKLEGRKKIVFVSGPPSHGFDAHEGYAGSMLLAKALNENVPQVYAEVYKWTWPNDPKAFDDASAIVIASDGARGHIAIPHFQQLGELMDKGVGLGAIHWSTEMPKGAPGDHWKAWIGGYFEPHFSVNPEWTAEFKEIPQHPVTRGVHPFTTHDEWYYHMRFRDEMKGVTPILSAVPPDSTREGKDGDYSGNPDVRAGDGKNIPETTVWLAERDHDGRGFGCTGGHFHWNWAQDDFRKTILNSILWIAHVEVPGGGVPSKTPTLDDLLANQDDPMPPSFNRDEMQKRIAAMNNGGAAK